MIESKNGIEAVENDRRNSGEPYQPQMLNPTKKRGR
jgi:hypothetical protein